MSEPPPPPPPPPPFSLIPPQEEKKVKEKKKRSTFDASADDSYSKTVMEELKKGTTMLKAKAEKKTSRRFSKQLTETNSTSSPSLPTINGASDGRDELLKEIEKGVTLKKKKGSAIRSDSFPKLKGTLKKQTLKEEHSTKSRTQSNVSESEEYEFSDAGSTNLDLPDFDPEKIEVEIWGHIQLNVAEARSSQAIQDAFIEVDVGMNRMTTTKQAGLKTEPFWGQDFSLELKGGLKTGIMFTLWSGLPDRKGVVVGQTLFQGLKDGEQLDGFFPVHSLKQLKDSYVTGSVHLQVKVVPIEPTSMSSSNLFPPVKRNIFFRIFNAQMLSYRNLHGFSDPYLKLSLGEESRKTKVVKKTVNPPWHQDFEFSGVEDSEAIISVWHWEKIGSHGFLGQAKIDIGSLETGVWNDMWVSLGPKDKDEKEKKIPNVADIRIRLKYLEELVLPISEYSDILSVLMGSDLETIHKIGSALPKKENFAKTMINLHDSEERALQFVQDLLAYEISTISSPDVIFRANTIGSKTLDVYLKMVGMGYLKETIGSIVSDIYSEKRPCEVDPSRTDKEKAQRNLCNLLYYSEKMVSSILNSLPNCPGTFKKVFYHLKMKVKEQGWDESVEYTVVSGFLFLRFFCAAILGPKLFDLVQEHPDTNTARTLTLVSKVVQNLANLVDFGQKEPYMKDMNAYLLTKFEHMKKFLKAVSTPPANEPLPQTTMISVAKEASHAYHLCSEAKENIRQIEQLDYFVNILDVLEYKIGRCSSFSKPQPPPRKQISAEPDLALTVPAEVVEWRSKLGQVTENEPQISKPQVLSSTETSQFSKTTKSKLEMQLTASVPLTEGREFINKLYSLGDSQLADQFVSWFPMEVQVLLKPSTRPH